MEKTDVYGDISKRTGGDIFVGVVGPVRTGKSTFIGKFTENLILPNIKDKFQKKIATDEMPQSAGGKTVMTTEPKFIPANAVKIKLGAKAQANVRLVDCVGYMVDGAVGGEEDGNPRMVKTPWSEKEIPFEEAAETGTRKVIDEYSTIGIVVTTDGTIGEIPRENYIPAEDKVIERLKTIGKPFVVVVNSINPQGKKAAEIKAEIEEKHGASVVTKNVAELSADGIKDIIYGVLTEFPMNGFSVDLDDWMRTMPADGNLIKDTLKKIKSASLKLNKMKDFEEFSKAFDADEDFEAAELCEMDMGEGKVRYRLIPKKDTFYKTLSEECGEDISGDLDLFRFIKTFSGERQRYDRIKEAFSSAEEKGYGVVMPYMGDMNLAEPVLVKKGGKYGVKLHATAPSYHVIKVDVKSEVSPTMGSEQQGEEFVHGILSDFEDDPKKIWDTEMFGKPLHDLMREGMNVKVSSMPEEARAKMRKTLTKMVNENRGGMICILL